MVGGGTCTVFRRCWKNITGISLFLSPHGVNQSVQAVIMYLKLSWFIIYRQFSYCLYIIRNFINIHLELERVRGDHSVPWNELDMFTSSQLILYCSQLKSSHGVMELYNISYTPPTSSCRWDRGECLWLTEVKPLQEVYWQYVVRLVELIGGGGGGLRRRVLASYVVDLLSPCVTVDLE